MDTLIQQLGLSRRATNALQRAGIYRVSQLVRLTDEEIYRIRGIGHDTFAEIRSQLAAFLATYESPPTLVPHELSPQTQPQASERAQITEEPEASNPFAALSPRNLSVLDQRYGLTDGIERTLEEVGRQMGLTRERIRQIEGSSLGRLRVHLEFRLRVTQLRLVLKQLGGLASDREVASGLANHLSDTKYDQVGLARLLAAGSDQRIITLRSGDTQLWLLAEAYPSDALEYLARALHEELNQRDTFCPPAELLAALKLRPDYPKSFPDELVLAFMRVTPTCARTEDGQIGLKRQGPKSATKQMQPEAGATPSEVTSSAPVQEARSHSAGRLASFLVKRARSLDDWEESLKVKIPALERLCQAPMSPDECVETGQLLRRLVETFTFDDALLMLDLRYPATLVGWIVAQHVHDLDTIDDLPAIAKATGQQMMPVEVRKQLGQLFERHRERYGLSHLHTWEFRLRPQIRRVELIGEISITSAEVAEIGRFLSESTRQKGVRLIELFFPATFAVFLVEQGIAGYRAGDFWTATGETLGVKLDANVSSRLGRRFESIVERFHLPLFTKMRQEALRYVSLILMHGGIPDYSLPDYFGLVHKVVASPQFADLPAAERIDEMLNRSATMMIDKPIRRFLEFGGRVAEDFFERSCELARTFFESGEAPDATTIGLPARVVDAYRAWVVEQETLERRIERADELRLRKPELSLDPWGEGLVFELPAQRVPATLSQSDFEWQVRIADGEPKMLSTRIRRIGYDLRTVDFRIPVLQPAAVYEVGVQVNGEIQRVWCFDGPTEQQPLLVFDPDRGTLIKWSNALPARRLWLVFPRDCQLTFVGEPLQFEDFPEFFGQWATYRAQDWDLARVSQMGLRRAGEVVLTLRLQREETPPYPHYVGGTLVSLSPSTQSAPLYVNEPPAICVPLVGRLTAREELSAWHLTIRNHWAAEPEIQKTLSLAELGVTHYLENNATQVDIPLSLPALLGPTPCGNFDIRLRGPLGRDASLPLRTWQNLSVRPIASIYVPDPEHGPGRIPIVIEMGRDDWLEVQDGGNVDAEPLPNEHLKHCHTVSADPGTTLLDLTLAYRTSTHEVVRVPLQIYIPRLRWALIDEQTTLLPDWQAVTVRQPLDVLLQMSAPALLIQLPPLEDSRYAVQLRLLDSAKTLLYQSEWVSAKPGQRLTRFGLTELLETVRRSPAPVTRLEAVFEGLPEQIDPIALPVLSVSQALVVEQVRLEQLASDGETRLRLTWREPRHPLRHRHVRIWPVWQPWSSPLEMPILDSAKGEHVFSAPPEFSLGCLRFQFSIVDPWAPSVPAPRGLPSGPGLIDIEVQPAEDRLHWLAQRIDGRPEQFALVLERAHICAAIGNHQVALESAGWCYQYLDAGTIPEALALCDLLESLADKNTLMATRIKLFTPARLERLLSARANSEIDDVAYEDYLRHLPHLREMPTDTWRKLMAVDVEQVQLAALRELIRRREASGIEAVLERLRQARLSDADAVALLAINGEFALDYLEQRSDSEPIVRLLAQAAPQLGNRVSIVQPGNWIRTDAGWGRIERIEDPNTGNNVPRFFHKLRRHLLHVRLRPAHDDEMVLIDLQNAEIRFLNADTLCVCGKCRSFAARDLYLVVGTHDRIAHGGVGAEVALKQRAVRILTEERLKFAAHAPDHQCL